MHRKTRLLVGTRIVMVAVACFAFVLHYVPFSAPGCLVWAGITAALPGCRVVVDFTAARSQHRLIGDVGAPATDRPTRAGISPAPATARSLTSGDETGRAR